MQMQSAPSYPINIYIAGDVHEAEIICRQFCMELGFCVTVSPCTYVYTGGAEAGVVVGIINYPRFPKKGLELENRARILADRLLTGLHQRSASIQTPTDTYWLSREFPTGFTG